MEPERGCGWTANALGMRAQHLRFAQEFIADWRREHPDLGRYVLGVAAGPGGDSLAVELNGLSNSGLYACDVDALFEAWAEDLGG